MIEMLVTSEACSSAALSQILSATQRIVRLIQIIAPIVLLVAASIHLIKLVENPDDKKRLPKLRNSFIAAAVIFFIPMFVNVTMNMLGDSTDFSSCWNVNASNNSNPTYIDPYDSKRTKIIVDPKDYEKGNPKKSINEKSGVKSYSTGSLTYNVYIPENPTTKMPLLMWLHGDNGSGSSAGPLGKLAKSQGYSVIVIAPTSPNLGSAGNKGWYEAGHLPELKKIIDEVCAKYECDKKNINIGGHSRGAIGTWMMVSAYPNFFHSAAPVSCCSSSGFKAANFKGVKVWAMRGSGSGSGYSSDDTYARCMQNTVNAVKPYAKSLKYTILPNTSHGEAGGNAMKNKEMIKFIFSN